MKTLHFGATLKISLLLLFALVAGGNDARAEHREISAELNANTPMWSQPYLEGGYPAGCCPVAWAIVYGYWTINNATNLFPGHVLDVTSNGTENAPVMAAIERIGYHVEISYREKTGPARDIVDSRNKIFKRGGRKKVGSTFSPKMCQGIRFAQESGFPHSRCFRLKGPEFDKFDHIYRYLNANRPVIISMCTKGHRATNHCVVIEKAKKIQEKVGGKWRDREVKYYVNYGWGNTKEWISARQVGPNEQVTTVTDTYLIDISSTPLPEASDANEAWCKEWCAEKNNCTMCSTLAGCGAGYKSIKSFKAATKNWYACRKFDTNRVNASEANRLACEEWCNNNPDCVKCSTKRGCSARYKNLNSWTGYGNNWHACGKRGPTSREQASDENHRACQEWCDSQPGCIKCSTLKGCGQGFKNLMSWTGRGKNWHACGHTERQEESDRNKQECEAWCKANRPQCEMCSTRKGCGPQYENLKSWTGKGTNWHACKKKETRDEASRGNKEACEEWCSNNSECARCSTKKGCGRGYKHLKSWTGKGTNWHACKKR